MKLEEFSKLPLMEMSLPRHVIMARANGAEETINIHLVKILAFEAPETTRAFWKEEVADHYRRFALWSLKPSGRRVPAKDWLEWLYAGPAEPMEGANLLNLLRRAGDDFRKRDIDADDVIKALRAFHRTASEQLARGENADNLLVDL